MSAGTGGFSVPQSAQAGCGHHPPSYSMGTVTIGWKAAAVCKVFGPTHQAPPGTHFC